MIANSNRMTHLLPWQSFELGKWAQVIHYVAEPNYETQRCRTHPYSFVLCLLFAPITLRNILSSLLNSRAGPPKNCVGNIRQMTMHFHLKGRCTSKVESRAHPLNRHQKPCCLWCHHQRTLPGTWVEQFFFFFFNPRGNRLPHFGHSSRTTPALSQVHSSDFQELTRLSSYSVSLIEE